MRIREVNQDLPALNNQNKTFYKNEPIFDNLHITNEPSSCDFYKLFELICNLFDPKFLEVFVLVQSLRKINILIDNL